MQILVNPCVAAKSSSSCNYTCPVYHMGIKGLKKVIRKIRKKNKKKKNQSGWKVCWYGN